MSHKERLEKDIEFYYRERNRFENSLVSRLTHNQRKIFHPILLKIISHRNKKAGFNIKVLYDNRGKDNNPKIFCVTHIGKYDVEVVSEVIREHYYLLSGDFENMQGTIEEKFLGINGVVYIREDDKEDRSRSKKRMIEILKQGGNMLYFPEGSWNLTPNLPVLPCAYGIIDVAMQAKVDIIPIGIEQYDNSFIVAVGKPFKVNGYSDNEKIQAIEDLRGVLAGLKWDIWCKAPESYCLKVTSQDEYSKITDLRLSEWTQSREALENNIFKMPNEADEKEVYSFLSNMKIDKRNCFLAKKSKAYLKYLRSEN